MGPHVHAVVFVAACLRVSESQDFNMLRTLQTLALLALALTPLAYSDGPTPAGDAPVLPTIEIEGNLKCGESQFRQADPPVNAHPFNGSAEACAGTLGDAWAAAKDNANSAFGFSGFGTENMNCDSTFCPDKDSCDGEQFFGGTLDLPSFSYNAATKEWCVKYTSGVWTETGAECYECGVLLY